MSNKEFIDIQESTKNSKKNTFKEVLDGRLLIRENVVKQFPYLFFLAFLAFIYIGNRYHAEKLKRRIAKLQKEQKDLRAESITTKSQLMFMSKQSEVAKEVKKRGLDLEESTTPPVKIVMNKE
ncbi:MAG: hypothetical protein GXO79_11995 [Chlorobi bacterium]|nr:hypothetical protein [Chlorobiota bacterium]